MSTSKLVIEDLQPLSYDLRMFKGKRRHGRRSARYG